MATDIYCNFNYIRNERGNVRNRCTWPNQTSTCEECEPINYINRYLTRADCSSAMKKVYVLLPTEQKRIALRVQCCDASIRTNNRHTYTLYDTHDVKTRPRTRRCARSRSKQHMYDKANDHTNSRVSKTSAYCKMRSPRHDATHVHSQ